MDIAIRKITIDDAEQFRKALDQVAKERVYILTLEAPSIERITNFIRNNIANGYPQYVAECKGEIVGWADFVGFEREGLKHTSHLGIGVIKEYRGKGIGKSLLKSVLAAAVEYGFKRLELEVFANNSVAINLYQSQGFIHEGTKRNARYIDNTYYDIHVMAKIFT